jgi:hypothetical protein
MNLEDKSIKKLIENYKKHITQTELKDEVYKWKLIKQFKGRPNTKAIDFQREIKEIKFHNLIYAMSMAVLNHLAKDKPEELRILFIDLFDESRELVERIKVFNNESLKLYRSLGETLSHHQDERSIATYLTFHYPEKYTFYKSTFYKSYCKFLGIPEANKNEKYIHYLELINELIEKHIKTDNELIELVKRFIPEFYNGSNHLLLAQDILYQMFNKKEDINFWLYAPGEKAVKWEEFYQKGIMGLGWDEIGDLTQYKNREEIKNALIQAYGGEGSKKNDISANDDFINKIKIGDVIIVKKGRGELLGYGIVTSDYKYDKNREDFQKIRSVEWKLKGNWQVDFSLVLKTLTDITKYESEHPNFNTYYERLLGIMGVNNSTKNYREDFNNWLIKKYGENSGTSSSYLKAIDILSQILQKEIFTISDDHFLNSLYDDLLKEQRNTEGKYYHSDAPSYGGNGFYSASIKSYKEFLTSSKMNKSKNTNSINYPLNTILYGPPGTGKTYHTVLRAAEIIENRPIDSYDEALQIFKSNLHNQIEFITFHQNYSYEDFIQGLRPDIESDGQLSFEKKDGVFKKIADKALKNINASEKTPTSKKSFDETFNEFISPLVEGEVEEIEIQMKKVSYFITAISNKSIEFRKTSGGTQHTLSLSTLRRMYDAESVLDIQGLSTYYTPLLERLLKLGKDSKGKVELTEKKNFVIIIDEINRANISRVFGELITLIEPDKRSHGNIPMQVKLPSGDTFIVPSNLFIIGTMNTADKSIALLDIALRRRFEFEAMYPLYEIDGQEVYDADILRKINDQIIKSKGHDFQIGHAYFMGENTDLVERMNKKVIPLLLEYYMNDEKEVTNILQTAGLRIEEKSWPLRITGKND